MKWSTGSQIRIRTTGNPKLALANHKEARRGGFLALYPEREAKKPEKEAADTRYPQYKVPQTQPYHSIKVTKTSKGRQQMPS